MENINLESIDSDNSNSIDINELSIALDTIKDDSEAKNQMVELFELDEKLALTGKRAVLNAMAEIDSRIDPLNSIESLSQEE